MNDYGPVLGIGIRVDARNMLADPGVELLGSLGAAIGAVLQEPVLEYGAIAVDSDEYEWIRLLAREKRSAGVGGWRGGTYPDSAADWGAHECRKTITTRKRLTKAKRQKTQGNSDSA